MTDVDLLAATSAARGLAHRAPLQEYSTGMVRSKVTGNEYQHTKIVRHSDAWARHGHSFCELAKECRERGLEIPQCDCPSELHEDI